MAGFRVIGVDKEPQKKYIGDGFMQMDALEFLRRYAAGEFERAVAIHTSPPCQKHSVLANLHKGKVYVDMIPDTRELLKQIGLPYVIENVEGARAELRNPAMLCGTMFMLRTSCGAELRRHRLFETNWEVGLLPECQHYAESPLGVYGGRARDRANEFARWPQEKPAVISVYGDHPRNAATEREKYPRSIGVYGTGQAMAGQRSTISVHGHSGGSSQRENSRNEKKKTVSVTGSTPQQNVVRNTIRECFPVSAAREAMGISWMSMKELSQAIPPLYTKFLGERLMDWLKESE